MSEKVIRHEAHHILRTRLFLKGIQCREKVLANIYSSNFILVAWILYKIAAYWSAWILEYLELASAFRWTNVAQVHLKVDKRRSGKCGHLRWGGLWASDASPMKICWYSFNPFLTLDQKLTKLMRITVKLTGQKKTVQLIQLWETKLLWLADSVIKPLKRAEAGTRKNSTCRRLSKEGWDARVRNYWLMIETTDPT